MRPEEVIYVDGGVDDPSREVVGEFTGVRTLSGDLSGVGRNRNIGAAVARGDVLVFLDDDSVITHEFIREVEIALQDPRVGVVAPIIAGVDADAPLQFWGIRTLGPWFVPVAFNTQQRRADRPAPTLQGRGAALVVRRELFERIGGFDDGLFAYGGEDFDLCWRVWMSGSIVQLLSSRVGHEAMGSKGPSTEWSVNSSRKLSESTANYLIIYLKNADSRTLLQSPVTLPLVLSFAAREGDPAALFRGLALAIGRLRTFAGRVGRRAKVQSQRLRSDAEICREVGNSAA